DGSPTPPIPSLVRPPRLVPEFQFLFSQHPGQIRMQQKCDLPVQTFVPGNRFPLTMLRLRSMRGAFLEGRGGSATPIRKRILIRLLRSVIESAGLSPLRARFFCRTNDHLLPCPADIGRNRRFISLNLLKPEKGRRHISDPVLRQPLDRGEAGTQSPNSFFNQSPLI